MNSECYWRCLLPWHRCPADYIWATTQRKAKAQLRKRLGVKRLPRGTRIDKVTT